MFIYFLIEDFEVIFSLHLLMLFHLYRNYILINLLIELYLYKKSIRPL